MSYLNEARGEYLVNKILASQETQDARITKLREDANFLINEIAHVYGWHIDSSESDSYACITYLADAVGMTPVEMGASEFSYGSWENAFFLPKPCMVKSDGTVDYYLDPNDYTKKIDGTPSDVSNYDYDGNAMMEWPKIWYKFVPGEVDGNGDFYCSNVQIDDTYHCWCNINSKNEIVSHFYTAIYNGTSAPTYSASATYTIGDHVTYSNAEYRCIEAIEEAEAWTAAHWEQVSATTRLRSMSGIMLTPANGNGTTSGQVEINRAVANNTTSDVEWYTDVYADRILINALLVLMGKSINTQATFGRGLDSGSQTSKEAYVTGTLDDKGQFWGVTANGNSGVKTFGMENWWGCVWHRTAGCVMSAHDFKIKLTYGTADGTTANGYNSTGNGYISLGTAPSSSGYVSKMLYTVNGIMPISVSGGSASTYYADYWYQNTDTYYLLAGGCSSNGVSAGAFCFNLSSTFAVAYWVVSAALSLKPLG